MASGGVGSTIARVEARDALRIVIDDAAQTRIAALGVRARFERRDVLTLGISPRDPLRLSVIERAAPTRLLRRHQALARIDRLHRFVDGLAQVSVGVVGGGPQALGELVSADLGGVAGAMRWARGVSFGEIGRASCRERV